MATVNDTIYLKIIADATQATNELNKFAGLGKQMGMITAAGGDVKAKFNDIKQSLGASSNAFKVFNNNLKESKNRFDMNTLSWMFGGMALQRVSLMLVRFMIPSMDKLEKLNTAASKKVMGLAAAFEFLKISLFETLANTPMFAQFVEWLIQAAIWLSEFTQNHPILLEMVAAFAVLGAILGTLAIGVGIWMQLAHLGKLLGIGTTGGLLGAVKSIGLALSMLSISNLAILGLGLLLLGALGVALAFEETRDMMKDIWEKGFALSFGSLISAFAKLMGVTITWQEGLKFVAAVGVFAFASIARGVNILTQGVIFIIEKIEYMIDSFKNLGTASKAVSQFLTGDFSGAASSIAEFGNTQKELIENQSGPSNQMALLQQENNRLWDEYISKGVGGVFEDAFGSASDFNDTLSTTPSVLDDINTTQSTLMDDMLSKLGTAEDPATAIGGWNAFGQEIQNDTDYFGTLQEEMDSWAATETVKTFRVQYVFDGTTADIPTFGSGSGNVGSITV